ncbi:(deoxy)nucleoside triphosphate pyrophosphohydrolase [Cyclobacterium salsum]|uniref:(deoxy)nucleoside triphosphate pyrophosphohydrolase n=1 Tax=Cyclobacterium salsum TaxID=2666329 RepID=UPI00192EAD1E|nr:(deoxy)nucleoside triphosphate pyrophosphohydrolase [Cyclobacterium salsum]
MRVSCLYPTFTSMLWVTCAVIRNSQHQILAVQRSEKMRMPLKWEFPGGKVEAGETEEEALIREIQEELGLNIQVEKRMQPVHHDYGDLAICLVPFWARTRAVAPILMEHTAYRWMPPELLPDLDWAAADIPIVRQIQEAKAWLF